MTTQRVGVLGAGGRMGRVVSRAVSSDPAMDLVAAVDPGFAGTELRRLIGDGAASVPGAPVLSDDEGRPEGDEEAAANLRSGILRIAGDIEELERARVDVAVDFTVASSAFDNARWCASHSVHAVIGTSGLSSLQLDELEAAFAKSSANCVVAPNFAVGAVLLQRFCELAAPFMQGVEIIELHHDAKADAPSGTSMHIAAKVADARSNGTNGDPEAFAGDPTTVLNLEGARGGSGPGGVHIHSVRLPGLVAHHEVVFGAVGQSLTLRHDSYDRTSFMPGVLLAVRSVPSLGGLVVGLDLLMGL
jgi:4-hydroxy-tetrahydrodipicolinate reductase